MGSAAVMRSTPTVGELSADAFGVGVRLLGCGLGAGPLVELGGAGRIVVGPGELPVAAGEVGVEAVDQGVDVGAGGDGRPPTRGERACS